MEVLPTALLAFDPRVARGRCEHDLREVPQHGIAADEAVHIGDGLEWVGILIFQSAPVTDDS